MKLIGVTGGTGMGKSTAQELLNEREVRTVDTDQLARDLVRPGQPALAEIRAEFGEDLVDAEGCLRRQELAGIVFDDPEARHRLENILHPRIRQCWMAEAQRWRGEAVALGAVIIPLLFETNAAAAFDATVCVACGSATQRSRLHARGWDDAEIQRRLAAQWSVERKIEASTFVVWTDGELSVHARQWDRVLQGMRP